MDDEIIGLPAIAELCDVAPGTARKWLERGLLPRPAHWCGTRPMWRRADIDRWRAVPRPPGRPFGWTKRKPRPTP